MKKGATFISALFFLGLVVVLFSGCELLPEEEEESFSVVVEVLDYEGNPLEDMTVHTSPETEIVTTDQQGRATLTDLQEETEIQVIDEDEFSFFESKTVSSERDEEVVTFEPFETRSYLEGILQIEDEVEETKQAYILLVHEEDEPVGLPFLWEEGKKEYAYSMYLILEEGLFDPQEEYMLMAQIGEEEPPVYIGYYGVETEDDTVEYISPQPLERKEKDIVLFPWEEAPMSQRDGLEDMQGVHSIEVE